MKLWIAIVIISMVDLICFFLAKGGDDETDRR